MVKRKGSHTFSRMRISPRYESRYEHYQCAIKCKIWVFPHVLTCAYRVWVPAVMTPTAPTSTVSGLTSPMSHQEDTSSRLGSCSESAGRETVQIYHVLPSVYPSLLLCFYLFNSRFTFFCTKLWQWNHKASKNRTTYYLCFTVISCTDACCMLCCPAGDSKSQASGSRVKL